MVLNPDLRLGTVEYMNSYPIEHFLPKASKLAYGCMGLGGHWDQSTISKDQIKQAQDVVDTALDSDINFFDHADIYTMGKAEQAFGQVLKERPSLRDQIYIQSKCAIRFEDNKGPGRYDFSAEWIEQSVEGILSRLNTEYLDVLLLHRPDPLMEPEEVAAVMQSLKTVGKVNHFGVSNMNGQQMAFLQSYLDFPLVANQIEISLQKLGWLDEGVMAGNPDGKDLNFTSGTLEYCRLNQVQIQSWGSLCQGLFSGRDLSQQPEPVQNTARSVAELAAEYQTSKEAMVLAFLMRHPAKIQPVIGTTDPARISACTGALNIHLSREHWYALYSSARGKPLP